MKVVVIGGTGHIGSYLIPRLVEAGHEVVCVSRQRRAPYYEDPRWQCVRHVRIDRGEAEQQQTFDTQIKALGGEVVVDLICFNPESAVQLVEALTGSVAHFIHCGTMWVHGFSERVPTREDQERKPFGDYGIKKAAIESYLLREYQEDKFPATVLHPGHITGPGWLPINPAGNLDPEVFVKLAEGKEVALPNLGMETVHHVHAADVAQAFVGAINHREQAVGESFHVVSPQALTLRGYATAMAEWFGQEAQLRFLPWEQWRTTVSPRNAELTGDHIAHSANGSIEKASRLLGYHPEYDSLTAVQKAVRHALGHRLGLV
ncbi:MAG: NAD-dependent epimerase/dehydratase family protein [Tunicatimonas sp.]